MANLTEWDFYTNLKDPIHSIPPKKKCPTNKTEVYHTDDAWSMDLLPLNDFGPTIKEGFRVM